MVPSWVYGSGSGRLLCFTCLLRVVPAETMVRIDA